MPDPNLLGTASAQEILNRASRAGSTTTSSTIAVSIEEGGAGESTPQNGQKKVSGAATATQLSTTSYVLANGLVITSLLTNVASGMTVGFSNTLNDKVDGTGNGAPLYPGGSVGIPSGVNLNSIWICSTSASDGVGYIGN